MENKIITINELSQFTGTEKYYRYHDLLLTDGAYYLAEKAACFWLMDAIWSYVVAEQWLGKEDFITCKLNVQDCVGELIFDDGNDRTLASQKIPYTDFPLEGVTLFIVRESSQFVVMLPGEY
jgi:hypothetical protein